MEVLHLNVRSEHTDDDLIALAGWLRAERELQGYVHQHRAPTAEGQLGGAFELISVAIGSGGIGSVLASALTTWLQNRPKTTIKITRGDMAIEVDAGRVKDIPGLVEKLLEVGSNRSE